MTEEHPDAILYRRTADAFRSGDLDVVKPLIAPDVVWHVHASRVSDTHVASGGRVGRQVDIDVSPHS